jgi:hypothetical protein
MKIMSIVQNFGHPTSIWKAWATVKLNGINSGNNNLDFVDATNEFMTGALNPAYFAASANPILSLNELDPTCLMAKSQVLAEQDVPTSRVGYTHFRRAIDYVTMLGSEIGTWWKEYVTLYHMALKARDANRDIIRDDAFVRNMLGWEEAFLLATGDLLGEPFYYRASQDPDYEDIMKTVVDELLSLNVIDHVGFDMGFAASDVGYCTHPNTGEGVFSLDTEAVTHLFTHPWRRACQNGYLRSRYSTLYNTRRPTAYSTTHQTTIGDVDDWWVLSEGGASTAFPPGTWDEIAAYNADTVRTRSGVLAEADGYFGAEAEPYNSQEAASDAMPFQRFDGELLKYFFSDTNWNIAANLDFGLIVNLNQANGSTGSLNDLATSDPHSGGRYAGAVNSLIPVEMRVDGTATNCAPTLRQEGWTGGTYITTPRAHTCGRVTATEMIDILRGLSLSMSNDVLHIFKTLGRVKKTLPTTLANITEPGGKKMGAMIARSMRDGYLLSLTPQFNIDTKLEYASQNGPLVWDNDLDVSTDGNGFGTYMSNSGFSPAVISGIGNQINQRWNGLDYSQAMYMTDLDGVTHSGVPLPAAVIGEYASGKYYFWSPPGIEERDLTDGLEITQYIHANLLSWPMVRDTATDAWTLIDFSGAQAGYTVGQHVFPRATLGMSGAAVEFDVNTVDLDDDPGPVAGTARDHYHAFNGFVRGLSNNVLAGRTWYYNPQELNLIGIANRYWKGSFMMPCSWVDPYRAKLFNTITAYLPMNEVLALDVAGVDTTGCTVTGADGAYLRSSASSSVPSWEVNPIHNFGHGSQLNISTNGRPVSWWNSNASHSAIATNWAAMVGVGTSLVNTGLGNNVGVDIGPASAAPKFLDVFEFTSPTMKASINGHAGRTLFLPGMHSPNASFFAPSIEGGQNHPYLFTEQKFNMGKYNTTLGTESGFATVRVFGEYMLGPTVETVREETLRPSSWLRAMYSGHTRYRDGLDDWTEYGDAGAMSPHKNTFTGACFLDGLTNSFTTIGSGAVLQLGNHAATTLQEANFFSKEMTHPWMVPNLVTTVDSRLRNTLIENPWSKKSPEQIGFISTNYAPGDLRSVNVSTRQVLKSVYLTKIQAGVSNELFRDLQIIN